MRIKLKNQFSENLALRDLVSLIFSKFVNSSNEKIITFDFKDISSISRSFAQEYQNYKKKSSKKILEINVSSNNRKMLNFSKKKFEKMSLIKNNKIKIFEI